jgi:hypothetical protein
MINFVRVLLQDGVSCTKKGADAALLKEMKAVMWMTWELWTYGCVVQLYWLPGHGNGILSHEIANELSRDMRKLGNTAATKFRLHRSWRFDGTGFDDSIGKLLGSREAAPTSCTCGASHGPCWG